MNQIDYEAEYERAFYRSITIDAILSLNPVFKREYLNTLTTDALNELEDSLINTQFET